MRRSRGNAVRHVARASVPAGGKTADPGNAAAEVGPVTFLAASEAALLPRLRFGVSAMQGGISPARRMSGRSVGMASLPVELRIEATHPGYSPQEIAAVTLKAQVPVAHKSRPVIDDPISGVLAGCIDGRPTGMVALPVTIRAETADLGYSPQKIAAVAF